MHRSGTVGCSCESSLSLLMLLCVVQRVADIVQYRRQFGKLLHADHRTGSPEQCVQCPFMLPTQHATAWIRTLAATDSCWRLLVSCTVSRWRLCVEACPPQLYLLDLRTVELELIRWTAANKIPPPGFCTLCQRWAEVDQYCHLCCCLTCGPLAWQNVCQWGIL